MGSLAEVLAAKPAPVANLFDMDMEEDDDDIQSFSRCLDEIDRYRRLDEWIPSYHNILSTKALDCRLLLIKAGVVSFSPVDFLQYTRDGASDILRINAFSSLMKVGMVKNDAIFRWFLFVLGIDPSPYVRDRMLRILGKTIGAIAIGESSDPSPLAAAQADGLVIEQESSTEARQADLARKQTVVGALLALKKEIGSNEVLKKGLWGAIASPEISLKELGELLDLCELLYAPESSMIVVLKYPRYWKCTKIGKVCSLLYIFSSFPSLRSSYSMLTIDSKKATLFFSQTSRIRTNPLPPRPRLIATVHPPSQKLKLQLHPPNQPLPSRRSDCTASSHQSSNPASTTTMHPPPFPRPLLKPPKKPSVSATSSSSSLAAAASSHVSGGAGPNGVAGVTKPKLTIKLKFRGGGTGVGGESVGGEGSG